MLFRSFIASVFVWGLMLVCLPGGMTAQEEALPPVMELHRAYAEQNGGRANISAFHSLIATGVIEGISGNEFDFKLFKKRPNLMRMHIDLPNGSTETVFDGTRGFKIISREGFEKQLSDLSAEDSRKLMGDSRLEGPFYRLRAHPEQLEVVGEVEVDGEPAYEIEVDPALDSVYSRIWLSKEHFQELKVRRVVMSPEGLEINEDVYFSDFEKVRGVWFAKTARYVFEGELRQTVRIEQVRSNVGIFDSYFERPRR